MERRVWAVILVAVVAAAAVSLVVGIILGGYVFRSAAGIPIEEIEFGGVSGYNFHTAEGCLTISDGSTWQAFWEIHQSRRMSPPPVPDVEFSRNTVLACFLGWQGNSGDSIKIVGAVGREGGGYWVFVERKISLQGLATPVNPYHLVQVPRPDGPSLFLDRATGELLPTLAFEPQIRRSV